MKGVAKLVTDFKNAAAPGAQNIGLAISLGIAAGILFAAYKFGPAPAIGYARTITRTEILQVLVAAGRDPAQFTFRGPQESVVQTVAIEVAGKRRDLKEARAKVGEEVQAFSGTRETVDPKNELAAAVVKGLTVDTMDTSRLVTSLAGRGSEAHRILYEAPAAGESKALLLHGNADDALQAVADKHGMTRAKIADLGKRKPFRLTSGRDVQLSASDRMMAAGLWSDPQNREQIIKTGLQFADNRGTVDRIVRVTEADMKGLADSLSPFEREWVAEFQKQFREWGISIDWTREFGTHEPGYYRWTQWIFLKLLEAGLAYRKEAAVNWCPQDATVLANEGRAVDALTQVAWRA